MIIENFMKCDECSKDKPVLVYEIDTIREQIRFYPYVHPNISFEFHKMKFVKKPSKYIIENNKYIDYERYKEIFDYEISCPLCGKFTNTYIGVPDYYDVFHGSNDNLFLMSVPMPKWVEKSQNNHRLKTVACN